MRTTALVIFTLVFSGPAVRAGEREALSLTAFADLGGTAVFAAAESLAPAPAMPAAPAVHRAADDIVAGEFGLPLLRVGINGEEAWQQGLLPGTAVPFEAALRSAMTSFLEDYADEESPLSLVIDGVFTGMGENAPLLPYPPQVVEKARARLNYYLNSGSTELRLLSVGERAEHGESVTENWIFFLWIPELSDHGHWAVMKRSGGGQVYNYGFN